MTDIVFYKTQDGKTNISIKIENETAWLNQNQIAELFNTSKQNINLHIENILKDNELSENSVVKYYLTTALDGKNYNIKYYNLDMILAIGYKKYKERNLTDIEKEYLENIKELEKEGN